MLPRTSENHRAAVTGSVRKGLVADLELEILRYCDILQSGKRPLQIHGVRVYGKLQAEARKSTPAPL